MKTPAKKAVEGGKGKKRKQEDVEAEESKEEVKAEEDGESFFG